MPGKFAKLFDTSHGQVLVSLEDSYADSNGEDLFPVRVKVEEHKGVNAAISPAFSSPEDAQIFFDSFEQADAERAVEVLYKTLDDLKLEPSDA